MKAKAPIMAFTPGQTVVYPAHGVGKIAGIETQEIAGHTMELLVVDFAQTKMTLRLPKAKALTSGLRSLATKDEVETALVVLKGRSKSRKGVWSRRANDFDAKIKSGNLVLIAEVIRDLAREDDNNSYSERQIYENAFGRFVSEIAQTFEITETEAEGMVQSRIAKNFAKAPSPDQDLEADSEEEAAA